MLEIFNLLGEKVHTQELNNGVSDIDTKELPNGVYIISIVENSKIIKREKVVKE